MTATARDHPAIAQDHEPVGANGLVTCAINLRVSQTEVDAPAPQDEFSQLTAYVGRFPSSQMLGAAAALYEALPPWDGHEGPRARITIAPGALGVTRRDLARRERTGERQVDAHGDQVHELAEHLTRHGELPAPPAPRREITCWSRKSRANMVQALCELDYRAMFGGTGTPAMVTLTYPGGWEVVAPNGRAIKDHFDEFCQRYRRAWGTDLVGIWKLEFQRRGAPHFHVLMVPPHGRAHSRADAAGSGLAFRAWLSLVWADIVGHPDPVEYMNHLQAGTGVDYAEGARANDPKKVAVYFTKHGTFRSKEYQHVVPDAWRAPGEGPGRFWGYRQMERVVHAVEVHPRDAHLIARLLRRWARAQGTTRELRAPRVRGGRPATATWDVVGLAGCELLASRGWSVSGLTTGTQLVAGRGPLRHRRVRRRVDRLRRGVGWVSVNDGAALASQLVRWLEQLRASASSTVLAMMGDRVALVPT